jgi:hypothetical protein
MGPNEAYGSSISPGTDFLDYLRKARDVCNFKRWSNFSRRGPISGAGVRD